MTHIKTFRGLIAHGAQDTIVLHTNNGSTGYRIVKFQLMTWVAGHTSSEAESTVKIYKIKQTTIDSVVDFSDNTLLGAGVLGYDADISIYPPTRIVTFDGEIFNQDIYVTHSNLHPDVSPCNYYIELEQVNLDLNESTVATLKDIRNSPRPI
jgi:hypothetical protein